jgi:RNA polymerase sigma-70 factor, ECF subfamily
METGIMKYQMEELLPAELSELSASGEDLFEKIYQQYYRVVYSICLRMTHNSADAEDLTHDTLLQMQRNLSSFRGNSALKSWLYRITINQVLMKFRKRSRHPELTTDDGELQDIEALHMDKASQTSIVDRIALARAIEKLAKGYRQIFILHDVEGYEHEEIAELLGITSGTSKSQLHKARMKLRFILMERNEAQQLRTALK